MLYLLRFCNFVPFNQSKKAITRHHTVIYVSALCASILCASSLTLRLTSLAYKCIIIFQGIFISVGFYTLLLLWHSIATSVQNNRYLLLLRYSIFIAFVLTIIYHVAHVSCELVPVSSTQATLQTVADYSIISTQLIIIVAVTYYGNTITLFLNTIMLNHPCLGITFWLKQDNLLANSNAKHALLLVTQICAIFLLGYLALFTSNMLEIGNSWDYGVEAEVASVVLSKLSYVLRIGALLFVINLRPKSNNQRKDRAIIKVDNKDNAATSVQSTNNGYTFHTGAIMSSNIDPDAQTTLENSTYYNTTTKYN
ncbi:hypothetical protein BDF19DRAFT_430921 [Syncephalis fuscata]|nr:hypothetical protein BDF19DRAFT_430921 [Syncephalis fuscata]